MAKSIRVPNGIITICNTDFKCPKCECPHTEGNYYKKFAKSNNGIIYQNCKGCKTKLGITQDFMGDIQVWLKEDEKDYKKLK